LDLLLDVSGGELIVDNVRVFDPATSGAFDADVTAAEAALERAAAFPGPNMDEAEAETLDAVQEFLAERRIDDELAQFVAAYGAWVEQLEYERWLDSFHAWVRG
jgi:complement component 1 Q subcomponent-binding protein